MTGRIDDVFGNQGNITDSDTTSKFFSFPDGVSDKGLIALLNQGKFGQLVNYEPVDAGASSEVKNVRRTLI